MTFQPEQPNYDTGVYQIETTDPVDGGVGSVTNSPLLNLANRTAYLYQHVTNLENGTTQPPGMAPINSPGFTGSPTAPTQALGDNSIKISNTAFVQSTVRGFSTINCAGNTNVVLTAVQAGVGILELTGALTGNISVIVPATSGKWVVWNQTTGAYTATVTTAAGAGIAVTQGRSTVLWSDGANVYDSKTDFPSAALTGTPTAPAAPTGDVSMKIANSAFVWNATDGLANVNVAGGAQVALTQAQYGVPILVLTGALTANINLLFPQQSGQWIVSNQSTGPYTITAKTGAVGGASIVLPQGGFVAIVCDGSNVFFSVQAGQTPAAADNSTKLATTAFVRTAIQNSVVGTIGASRSARMSVTSASSSATFTADQVIVGTALNGIQYALPNYSQTINLAITGAGGMDTGSAPASGFVALYAIYNPATSVTSILATNATSSIAPTIYGGVNMPAGYTASALISVWPTNSSGQLASAFQNDRRITTALMTGITTTTISSSWTLLSIANCVPPNARWIRGTTNPQNLSSTSSGVALNVAADSSATGEQFNQSTIPGGQLVQNFSMDLRTPQTIYYSGGSNPAVSAQYSIYTSAYEF